MDCDEDYVIVPPTSSSSDTSETSEDREDTQIQIDYEPVDVVLNMDIMQDIPQNVQQPGIGRRVIVQILRSFRVLKRLSKIAMNHVLISHVPTPYRYFVYAAVVIIVVRVVVGLRRR